VLQKPWAYGDSVFHTIYRYSYQHSHFWFFQHI